MERIPRSLAPDDRADLIRELFDHGFKLCRLADMTDFQVASAIVALRGNDGVRTLPGRLAGQGWARMPGRPLPRRRAVDSARGEAIWTGVIDARVGSAERAGRYSRQAIDPLPDFFQL